MEGWIAFYMCDGFVFFSLLDSVGFLCLSVPSYRPGRTGGACVT
jgi:hypothetical protein